jgi:glycerate kinase
VDAFLAAMGGSKIFCRVNGPLGETIDSFYGILPREDGKTAIIEMAAAAGLPLLQPQQRNPAKTSSYGVGQLILDAVKQGCDEIILGLGGSCTNDFGCGAAAAVGVRFYDAAGESFVPVGGNLAEIADYNLAPAQQALSGVKIQVICDIDNPVYGANGAAAVFAPQKGADDAMVRELDSQLQSLARLIAQKQGVEVQQIKGGGAAGAMGAGIAVFLGGTLRSGIDTILDTISFEQIAPQYDCILTGEGKFDKQSLGGKVCIGIARRAKALQIPVIVIAGGVLDPVEAAYAEGVSAVFSINRLPEDLEISASKSADNLIYTTENIIRSIRLNRKGERKRA